MLKRIVPGSTRWALLTAVLALAVLGANAHQGARPVHAAGILVNSLADEAAPSTDGACTLREAMQNANDNAATYPDCPAGTGADTISFVGGGVVALAGPLPAVPVAGGALIINGGGVITIDGAGVHQPLLIGGGATVTLNDLFISNGRGAVFGTDAGAGAIDNFGNLTIARSRLFNNSATSFSSSAVVNGGAIINQSGAQLAVNDTYFVGNTAQATNFNAFFTTGGAITSFGTLSVRRSTFSGNNALGSGAEGGAIAVRGGTATISNSTFSGNQTNNQNNSVTGGGGGGVSALGGSTTLINTTFKDNQASGFGAAGGGVRQEAPGAATLQNSVLKNAGPVTSADCSGTIATGAPNLTHTAAPGCTLAGVISGVDPLLGSLSKNNGLATSPSHALLAGSPAIGAGSAAVCAAAPVDGEDQRRILRPQGTGCDLGSYEAGIIGGKNFAIGTGSVVLSWDGGTAQTGYTLLRYNTVTTAATLLPLGAGVTSYTDTAAVNGIMYCYVLASMGGHGVLGLSELECALPGSKSGTVQAQNFKVGFAGSFTAAITWTAPVGGADSYLLQIIPLNGNPPNQLGFGGGATQAMESLSSEGVCFQLIAFKGAAFGTTDVLCAIPGVGTLGAELTATSLAELPARLSGVRFPTTAPTVSAQGAGGR